ncbi:MAG: PHP domain-containing protein, partial [Bacteroidales bacterium]|nr:PHP domain-containing protein [Bacteroidales bacterium]
MFINAHSYYSLRYGTLPLEEMVKISKNNHFKAIALTDINNSTGVLDFVNLCRKNNIHPIAGIEFRNDNKYLYTGIARNNEGFRELNDFVSQHNINKEKIPETPPPFHYAYVLYPFGSKNANELNENEFIGIKPAEARKIFTSEFQNKQDKLIIQKTVTFPDTEGFFLHRHLRAIDNNILLSQLKSEHLAMPDETIDTVDEMLNSFKEYPQLIKNTERLVSECSFDFDFKAVKNKQTFTGSLNEDKVLLEKLAFDGLIYR